MNNNLIQNLLQQVSAIKKHYDKIAETTGENFNIFKILNVQTKEVRLHSNFIAELLNPQGSHGQKDVFLNLFMQKLNINDFDTQNACVEVEKHVGWINEYCTEGGYIDIVISSNKGQRIIIENKIYAGDQKNQLFRYHQFDKNAQLFYLSLDGKSPSEWSKNGLEEDKNFIVISYKEQILKWLEASKKESVNHPLLRETITQYINLIKTLTNQSINNMQNQEIQSIILNNFEVYSAAELISFSLPEYRNQIKNLFWNDFNSKFKLIEPEPIKANFISENAKIILEIGDDEAGLYFGFYLRVNDEKVNDDDQQLKKLIGILQEINAEFKVTPDWIGWKFPNAGLCNFVKVPLNEVTFRLENTEFRNRYIDCFISEIKDCYNSINEKVRMLSPVNV